MSEMLDEATARALAAEDRADDAEAKLAQIHQTVVDGFLGMFGTSTLASFAPAIDLAWSVRKILDGSGVAARQAAAEAERERLLAELAGRRVTVLGPATVTEPPQAVDMVPWAALLDLLSGRPTVGFKEVPGEPEEVPAPVLGALAAVAAERNRIRAALAARKVTLTRPGWGFRAARDEDMVPWETVAEVLGSDGTAAAGDGEALARVRQLAKTWAGLPPDTAAALTLRHAGAQLLAITGESEPKR